MIYMLLNMIIAAWMIGSITLLIVKTDEQTSMYRETLQTLDEYSKIHGFDRRFRKRLRTSAQLYFKNRQIADEEVLQTLPVSVRRKVLRKLYLPCILNSRLMRGIRQLFVDAFLSNCTVEVFSAGEEILVRGSASSDLYLLVEGSVEVVNSLGGDGGKDTVDDTNASAYETTSNGGSDGQIEMDGRPKKLEAGRFINDVEFFTETPQTDTIRAVTVIKTLTLSLASYKMIANDHPGSVGKILANLLGKVEEMANENETPEMTLTKRLEVLQAGSVFDPASSRVASEASSPNDDDDNSSIDMAKAVAAIQSRAAVVACRDVIKMHIDKLKDDHTTRFLFAASRDNTGTIAIMCDQGFNPNSSDYDKRNALMIASMVSFCVFIERLFCHKLFFSILLLRPAERKCGISEEASGISGQPEQG
jgi:CRP-like cAMP-binding protein